MISYEPGDLLLKKAAGSSISDVVLVFSGTPNVQYVCAMGRWAGRLQSISPQTCAYVFQRASVGEPC